MMNSILFGILLLLALKTLVELFLARLNRQYTAEQAQSGRPDAFKELMDEASYKKSIAYTLDKSRFNDWTHIFETCFMGLVLSLALLPTLLRESLSFLGYGTWSTAFSVVAIQILLALPMQAFDYCQQFQIEERYGFNRSTPRLWWMDRIKGFILMLILGTPVAALLIAFYKSYPTTWWIFSAMALTCFQLLMMILYPRLILPLFNKLSPLPEGDFKKRLMDLAGRAGFEAKTIEVIDGSKRSTHSNAFFTGFGRFRRIVFFDTLLQQLSIEELEAVLAHEIGHYKKGHVLKHLGLSVVMLFSGFAAINWLLQKGDFLAALGLNATEASLAFPFLLIIASWFLGLILFWFSPFMHAYSRRHEYEADAFAKKALGNPGPLVSALRKLHKENLSNPHPHPLFSRFYYSHPTLLEREAALDH